MNAAAKLNRAGRSHSGRIMRVLDHGFYGEDRLSAINRIVYNALFSFTQKGTTAEFTYHELCDRFGFSYASARRAIHKAIDNFFKRGDAAHEFLRKEEDVVAPKRYFYIYDWLRHAEFIRDGERVTLTENQVEVLSYIIHQNIHCKGWNRSQAGIARDLEIAPSTISNVIALLTRLEDGKLLKIHCSDVAKEKSVNHYTKTFYTVDMEILKERRDETVKHAKGLSQEAKDRNYATDRERFYAERQRAAHRHEEAVRKALGEDFARLEKEIHDLELVVAKAQVERNREIMQRALERRIALNKARKAMLDGNAFTEDDLKPRFYCAACNDTGWRLDDRKPCGCYSPPGGNV